VRLPNLMIVAGFVTEVDETIYPSQVGFDPGSLRGTLTLPGVRRRGGAQTFKSADGDEAFLGDLCVSAGSPAFEFTKKHQCKRPRNLTRRTKGSMRQVLHGVCTGMWKAVSDLKQPPAAYCDLPHPDRLGLRWASMAALLSESGATQTVISVDSASENLMSP